MSLGALLLALALLCPSAGMPVAGAQSQRMTAATPQTAATRLAAEDRLADLLVRIGRGLLQREFMDRESLDTAIAVLDLVQELRPQDVDDQRTRLLLASLREDESRRLEALARLRRLDPASDVLVLADLEARIDRIGTVPERLSFYERIVRREVGLPATVRSRLALDAALLANRAGDTATFARFLAEAASLDASNRGAAAIAAGYFRLHARDAREEAELLINLFLADPVDPTTPGMLAELALRHGAYAAAARFLDLQRRTYITSGAALGRPGGGLVPNDLIADLAIARWGLGDLDGATRLIREQQRRLDEEARRIRSAEDPDLAIDARSRIRASLGPALETTLAVLLLRAGAPDGRAAAATAVQTIANAAEEAPDGSAEAHHQARAAEEAALTALWLGIDAEAATALLTERLAAPDVAPETRARWEGWIALRRDAAAEALLAFGTLGDDDVIAHVGRGRALERLDRPRDAAHAYLAAARSKPGSLPGVAAADDLMRLIGARAPISRMTSDLEALVATVPSTYDRVLERPTDLLQVRLHARHATLTPGDLIAFDLELENIGVAPLAIHPEGPVRPQVVIELESGFGSAGIRPEGLPALVIDIDHRLSLAPRNPLRIPILVGRHPAASRIEQHLAFGGFLRATAIVNPVAVSFAQDIPGQPPRFRPGALGGKASSDVIRLEGVPPSGEAMERLLVAFESEVRAGRRGAADSAVDGRDIATGDLAVQGAVLSQLLGVAQTQATAESDLARIARFAQRLESALLELPGVAQAWIIGVTPPGRLAAPLHEHARRTTDRWVRIVYMLAHIDNVSDPFIAAAIRGDDEILRRFAELYVEDYRRIEARIRQRDLLEGLLPSR